MQSELDEDLRLCQAIQLKHVANQMYRRALSGKKLNSSELLETLDLMNLASNEVKRLKGRTKESKSSTEPNSENQSGSYVVRETQTEEQRQVDYPISWGEVAADCYDRQAREDLVTAHQRASSVIRAGGDTWPIQAYFIKK